MADSVARKAAAAWLLADDDADSDGCEVALLCDGCSDCCCCTVAAVAVTMSSLVVAFDFSEDVRRLFAVIVVVGATLCGIESLRREFERDEPRDDELRVAPALSTRSGDSSCCCCCCVVGGGDTESCVVLASGDDEPGIAMRDDEFLRFCEPVERELVCDDDFDSVLRAESGVTGSSVSAADIS